MTDRLVIQASPGGEIISSHLYGHFAEHLGRCIYDGFYVGEDSPIPNVRGIRTDIVEAFRKIKAPNLRWPGGCFADNYSWTDGIGPKAGRPRSVNAVWGMDVESNHFGTHEFFDLCGQIGCEPYICGNLGTGDVRQMSQWLEYMTSDARTPMADLRRRNGRDEPWKLTFWAVGNEAWGWAGWMRPEQYADEYKRFATYSRSYPGNPLCKVACGAQNDDYRWTDVLMRDAGPWMDALAFHYYCGFGWQTATATDFREDGWFRLLQDAVRTDELLTRHSAVMDAHDPARRVGLMVDEWGTWHTGEPGTNLAFLYQQNTLRDAMVAAVTLNILNRHCGRVRMGCIAQAVNVLQAMVLTRGEKMLLTPTYHVFDLYAPHHDAALLKTDLRCADYALGGQRLPGIDASASRSADGRVCVSLCNLDPGRRKELAIELRGLDARAVRGRALTSPDMTVHNTFDRPSALAPADFDGARPTRGGVSVELPPKSIVVLEIA